MSGAPTDPAGTARRGGGLISLFVRHPTAPNLLMLTLMLVGAFAIAKLNRQFFPNFDVPSITITVAWPGASAEDTEANILDILEPELRFLDGIEEVNSYAREGAATISLQFSRQTDMQKAQSDVEQAIARITTLPDAAERPIVSRSTFFDRVANIAISGPFSEKVLKSYAKQLRDGLLDAGIDRVTLRAARDEEIWIRVRDEDLRRLGLTIEEISRRVRENTQDLPAGRLEGANDMQLRARSERKTPEAIGAIEIKSLRTGEKVLLGDVAEVDTRFDRDGKIGLVKGERAIELIVERSIAADTLKTMAAMEAYIAKVAPTLPPTLKMQVYDVRGKLVQGRLGILVENGLQGLALVLLMLFIFLNARIAFWVAAGIPVAMLATLGVMYVTGQSINMVSMFALIMMLGIIVDDAIVVGEHTATLEAGGSSRLAAAEDSAYRMLAPVVAAMLTTVAAFLPIFFIGDRIGDIMRAIPLVVIAAIIASVIECFLVLPGHLRHGRTVPKPPSRMRRSFDRAFNAFRDGPFHRFVKLAFDWRYTTVAVLVASLIVSVGLLSGGRLKFVFFPTLEPENITAYVNFSPGMPREEQIKAVTRLEQSIYEAERRLVGGGGAETGGRDSTRGKSSGGAPGSVPAKAELPQANGKKRDTKLVEASFVTLGQSGRAQGDNLAEIDVQLTPSEDRVTRTRDIIAAWRRVLPQIAGLERIALVGRRGGPPGRDVDVRLRDGPIEVLKKAAEEVKQALTGYPGVSGIDDDLPYGKRELVFELTPRGTALGFTGTLVGQQIRNAFEGAIATRFARGDDEITVRILRRQDLSGPADLARFYLTSPQGVRVPLGEAVSVRERQSFSIVQRRDGLRAVSVTGDIDTDVTTVEEVIARLERELMPKIAAKHGITYQYKGRDEERSKSFQDLRQGALLALALMYIILGWVFASYWKPFAVMAIIPFGFVGAVVGHYVMGYDLTIISMIGLLGLSGILVNDSIVLVSRVKERLDEGDDLAAAAIGAARDRFRAVLLTSLTTIGGLLPLVFETSRQAQFLIPMALTIVFGLAGATILVLLLVPALVGVGADIARVLGAIKGLYARDGTTTSQLPKET